MKMVLLTVSLLANVALAGALIYTIAERDNLDRQRESLAITNEQYQKDLEESSSTDSIESQTDVANVSNSYTNNSSSAENSMSSEERFQEATGTSEGIKLFRSIYYFDGFNGTITSREGEVSHMSEHFTRSPITVTDSNGTYNADLYTNNDGTAQIMQNSDSTVVLYSGTYEHEQQ